MSIWGFVCQTQVSRAGTNKWLHPTVFVGFDYLSLPWYLRLEHKSSFDDAHGRVECFRVQYITDYYYTTWQTNIIAATWYLILLELLFHYNDVIMGAITSQITSLTIVYSIVYSDADQRKHQSSASLAFVRWIHRDRWIPRTNGQLRGKCFHLMTSSCVAHHVTHLSIGCRL